MSLQKSVSRADISDNSIDTNDIDREQDGNTNNNEYNNTNNNDNVEVTDKEQLLDRIKNIPIEKLQEIITNQIDLEIRLKHKELNITEEEIGKCESQMITLRNYFKIPREKSIDSEPNDFTVKYFDLLNRSLSVNYDQKEFKDLAFANPHNGDSISSNGSVTNSLSPINGFNANFNDPYNAGHTYRTRSTTSSLRPSASSIGKPITVGCLYRRTDGIIVKLTCPDCKRSNFSSAQGFLNHSRIAHTQEYTSQDAAALICGDILPDNEQDEEGLNSIKILKEKNLDPSKNLNINEIYFNGLSNSLNTVHKLNFNLEKSISPLDNEDRKYSKPVNEDYGELMKKLIKNGTIKDKQGFETYIKEFKVNREEIEIISESDEDKESTGRESEKEVPQKEVPKEEGRLKRRRSRANVGIATEITEAKIDQPPLKLRIKLRSDDKRKKLRK